MGMSMRGGAADIEVVSEDEVEGTEKLRGRPLQLAIFTALWKVR
jgi:hypothetical protein